ncbi:MAG TPA: GNAT family N-acetyltransferase [Candidatus Lokiarchaeia archaeon]|nr:GNAT family N-acetyltransferase [Candidatus Lokiarchaeia archaeon]
MSCTWIDAPELWDGKNNKYLNLLLENPIENSPVFTYAALQLPGNHLIFWHHRKVHGFRGWAMVHGTPTSSTVVIRGDVLVYRVFFKSLHEGDKVKFEYIRGEETKHFSRFFLEQPVPSCYYYEIDLGTSWKPDELVPVMNDTGCKAHVFDPDISLDLIAFYQYPATSPSTDIFPRLNGLYMTRDGKIIAALYDRLSILPRQLDVVAIGGVLVAEDERNKGFCKALVREYLERLHDAGTCKAGLFVSVHNEPAIKCYENAGFTRKKTYYELEGSGKKSSS